MAKSNHHLSFSKMQFLKKLPQRLIIVFIKKDKHICPHSSLNVPVYKAYQKLFPQQFKNPKKN